MVLWFIVKEEESILHGLKFALSSAFGSDSKPLENHEQEGNSAMAPNLVDSKPDFSHEVGNKQADNVKGCTGIPPLHHDGDIKPSCIQRNSAEYGIAKVESPLNVKSDAYGSESVGMDTQQLLMQAGDVELNPGPKGRINK